MSSVVHRQTVVLVSSWLQGFNKLKLFVSVGSQKGSNYGSLLTGDGNLQIFAKTGYYKVRELLHLEDEDDESFI